MIQLCKENYSFPDDRRLGLSLILSQYGQDLVDEWGRRTREITCCSVAVLDPDGVMPDVRAMPGAPFWGDPRKM